MDETLIRKLTEIERKYEELGDELATPEVATDHKRYQKVAKARVQIEPLVELFGKYKKDSRELDETRKLLAGEADPELRAMYEEEIARLEALMPGYEERLKILLLPKDPLDEKNTILEISAGTGGEEAALFAGELARMYTRYAERRGWKVEVLDVNRTELGGVKEITFTVSGENVYSRLKYESGVHRVQSVPATEASGRIHTSAAKVSVLPEADELEVEIRNEDLRVDTFCSSGHGGQSVNTTYSAVRITHLPSGLVVSCQDEKSQIKNRAKALKVLRSRLLDLMAQEQNEKMAGEKRSQIKSGDRSEKFRTYNFPQNRVTTHTIGHTVYNLQAVLDGDLDVIIDPMITLDQAERLKNL